MNRYRYSGRDESGKRVTGEIRGASKDEVVASLLADKTYPSSVRRKIISWSYRPFPVERETLFLPLEERIGFYYRLATLQKAGIPLVDALKTVGASLGGAKGEVVAAIRKKVEGGHSFGEALGERVPSVERAIVMAGERAGRLDEGLERLTKTLERTLATHRMAADAFRYPLMVIAALTVAVMVMLGFVIPRLSLIFEGSAHPLPWPTRALLAINDLMGGGSAIAILVIAGVAVVGYRAYVASPEGRRRVDKLMIEAPLFGKINLYLSLGRWCHTLASLLASGVPVVEGVEASEEAFGNSFLGDAISNAVLTRILEGEGVSTGLRQSGVAPTELIQIVEVAEQSGTLDESLHRAGRYFTDEAERLTKGAGALVEPALVVVAAGAVLFVGLAVLLPVWDMVQAARG